MSVKSTIKENLIEIELMVRVEALGGVCEKTKVISRRGFFDRLVILPPRKLPGFPPRIVFVELKRPRGGRLSPHQKARIAFYEKLGVEVAVVKNSEDIDRLLKVKK